MSLVVHGTMIQQSDLRATRVEEGPEIHVCRRLVREVVSGWLTKFAAGLDIF